MHGVISLPKVTAYENSNFIHSHFYILKSNIVRKRHYMSFRTKTMYIRSFKFQQICKFIIDPYGAYIFCPAKVVCLLCLVYRSKNTQNTDIMEANIMNPNQTVPKGAVWSVFILFAI